MGFVGLMLVNGEYVEGEFYVFMVIIEGILLVSYSCGMCLICEVGGIIIIVIDDVM